MAKKLPIANCSDVLENTKAKSVNAKVHFWPVKKMLIKKVDQLQSCCCSKRMLSRHQDIRSQEIKTPRQDKAEVLALLCFACLLGWILLGRMDGSYAWIGSEIQFRIVNRTPQGVRKVQYIHNKTIHSYLCYINPYS